MPDHTVFIIHHLLWDDLHTHTLVSIIRYMTVVKGSTSHWVRSTRYALVMCLVLWLIVFLGKIPILIVHGGRGRTSFPRGLSVSSVGGLKVDSCSHHSLCSLMFYHYL